MEIEKTWLPFFLPRFLGSFSSLLLLSTKSRDPWEGTTPEERDLRHLVHAQSEVWQILNWPRMRNDYSAHAQKIGPFQRSLFFVLTGGDNAVG